MAVQPVPDFEQAPRLPLGTAESLHDRRPMQVGNLGLKLALSAENVEDETTELSGEFNLTVAQAQTIDSEILETESLWLTKYYSLALHNKDLIKHAIALEKILDGTGDKRAIPPAGHFHHPEVIRENALRVLRKGLLNDNHFSLIRNEREWSLLFSALAAHNLQLLGYIEQLQEITGSKSIFDRRILKRDWNPEEDEQILEVRGRANIEALAAQLGSDPLRIQQRRSILRNERREEIRN